MITTYITLAEYKKRFGSPSEKHRLYIKNLFGDLIDKGNFIGFADSEKKTTWLQRKKRAYPQSIDQVFIKAPNAEQYFTAQDMLDFGIFVDACITSKIPSYTDHSYQQLLDVFVNKTDAMKVFIKSNRS